MKNCRERVLESDFETFFYQCEKPLFNTALRWLWNHEHAADCVQETMLILWKCKEQVTRDKWRSFAFSTLLNMLRNYKRRAAVWDKVKNLFVLPLAQFADAESQADYFKVQKQIDSLPEDLKRVLVLSEFSGLSYQEIADLEKIPTGTVGSRRNRALKLLQDKMVEL